MAVTREDVETFFKYFGWEQTGNAIKDILTMNAITPDRIADGIKELMFTNYDKDGSGTIDEEELKQVIADMGVAFGGVLPAGISQDIFINL